MAADAWVMGCETSVRSPNDPHRTPVTGAVWAPKLLTASSAAAHTARLVRMELLFSLVVFGRERAEAQRRAYREQRRREAATQGQVSRAQPPSTTATSPTT